MTPSTRRLLARTGMVLALGLLASAPGVDGQLHGVLGFDGIISDRAENAFGAGVTLTYGHSALVWRVLGFKTSLKAMGFADAEFVAGNTEPDICRQTYYYRRCSSGDAVPPSQAEAPSTIRSYVGGYLVLDVARVRFAGGGSAHPGAGDLGWTALVGVATTPSSWVMVGFPLVESGAWRLRIEMTIAGDDYVWN